MIGPRLAFFARLGADAFRMAGPYRGWLVLVVAISLAATAVEVALLLIAIPLVSDVFKSGGEMPALFAWAKGVYRLLNPVGDPTRVVIVLIVLMIQSRILEACQQTLQVWANARILTFIRITIVDKVLAARFGLIDRMQLGALRQIIASEASRVTQVIGDITRLVARVLALVVKCLLLAYLSPSLTIVFLVLAAVLAPLKVFSVRYIRARSQLSVDSALAFMDRLNETLNGIRQVKLQNRQREFSGSLRDASDRQLVNMAKARILNSWEPAMILVLALACVIGVIAANARFAFIEFGILLGYLLMLYRTLPDVTSAAQAVNSIVQNQPGVVYVSRFFNLGEGQRERSGGITLDPGEIDEIRMRDVTLSYVKDEKVLDGITLRARRGEFVAIVGPSGAGKSSILHLLLSMYAPDSGKVSVGGTDIAELSPDSLRRCIGLVSQDLHVFNTTIREIVGGGNAALTEEDIVRATKAADAHDFVAALPDGYDTVVGDRGATLSGGQKQRVFLAQILARGTPVIILDEATSALDAASAARILHGLQTNRADRILVVITHRLNQVREADRIYFLKEGRIRETGTYHELIAARGEFWRLAAVQNEAVGGGGDGGEMAAAK